MPSNSRPLFVPLLCCCGTAELLSSLPLAEEPVRSLPKPRFLVDLGGASGLPAAARRCESISFFRLFASSLFSSVSFRSRFSGTQSSHLRDLSASRVRRMGAWRRAREGNILGMQRCMTIQGKEEHAMIWVALRGVGSNFAGDLAGQRSHEGEAGRRQPKTT